MRVLIVDISRNFKDDISINLLEFLSKDSLTEKASSPLEALEKIELFHPDVILANYSMISIKTDELAFIDHIKNEGNLPVIAYGVIGKSKVPYKELGIADYIEKSTNTPKQLAEKFYNSITEIMAEKPQVTKPEKRVLNPGAVLTRAAWKKDKEERTRKENAAMAINPQTALQMTKEIAASIKKSMKIETTAAPADSPPARGTTELIAIGSSTGGTEALSVILKELHPPLPPIVIAQHIPALFAKLFAERLNSECRLTVQEGKDGEPVKKNTVYIAPGNLHMTVERAGGSIVTRVKTGPKVHSCRPSVDVLFKSVAENIGASALGVILTGMGHDGAEGLLNMRNQGSYTLGQDQATCVVYGMPRAAFEMGAVCRQLPLTAIAKALEDIAR